MTKIKLVRVAGAKRRTLGPFGPYIESAVLRQPTPN